MRMINRHIDIVSAEKNISQHKNKSGNERPAHPAEPTHTVSHVTLLVSSGKFMSGSAFFLSPPENKKAKFAFCTLKRKGGSTQKQPFLTVRFRGALLTKSVTLEFSQDTVWGGSQRRFDQC